MKKTFSWILALALLLTCLVVPASAETDPVVVTVAVADKTNVEDYNTNLQTLYVEEKLGVDLQITAMDSSDYKSKINLMVNAGDELHDVIVGSFGAAMVYDWASQGALTPITEYYYDEAVAVNLIEAIDRVGYDFRPLMIMPDGEIYAFPNLNQSYGNEHGAGRMWIYKPFLDTLGEELPTDGFTTEQFEALLEKALATDLNGNGVNDEIGIVGWEGITGTWFSYLMNPFVECTDSKNWMIVRDGTVSFAFATDAWRQGVEWIKGLLDKGLIPDEALTQDFATAKTMVNTEEVIALCWAYTNADGMTDVERKGNYYVMAPLVGPNGEQNVTLEYSTPGDHTVISADCENPEMAFKAFDLMLCEELSITTRFGERGVEWDYVTDLDNPDDYENPYQAFPGKILVYNDSQYWGSGAMQNKSWMQANAFIRQYGIAAGMVVPKGNASEFDLRFSEGCTLYQTSGYNPEEFISKLVYSAEEQEIVTDVSTDLIAYVKETTAAWLTGAQVLDDASWEAFLAQVEDLNAAGWLEVAQAAYNRASGK